MNKYQAILKHILPMIEVYPVTDTENWARAITYKDHNNTFKFASIHLAIDVQSLPEILKNYILYHEYAHIINNILNPNITDPHGPEYQEILGNLLPTHLLFQDLLKYHIA